MILKREIRMNNYERTKKEVKESTAALYKDFDRLRECVLYTLEKHVYAPKNSDEENKKSLKNLQRAALKLSEDKARCAFYEAFLKQAKFTGIKPDVYLIPRAGTYSLDPSYHYLRKIIKSRYDIDLEVRLFENKHKKMLKSYDPLKKLVEFDNEGYLNDSLECDFNTCLSELSFVVVVETKPNGDRACFIYGKRALINGSSTVNGSSLNKELQVNESQSPDKYHKAIQMVKKTAIRMYIRETFADLSELDDLEYDDYGGYEETESVCNEEFELIQSKLEAVTSVEALELIGKIIKDMDLSPSERETLRNIYKKKQLQVTKNEN